MTSGSRHQEYLSVLLQMLGGITGMEISLCTAEGTPLIFSEREQRGRPAHLHADSGGVRDRNWFRDTVRAALGREEITIAEAPRGGFAFFIPAVFHHSPVIIAGREPAFTWAVSGGMPGHAMKGYQEVRDLSVKTDRMFRIFLQLDSERVDYRSRHVKTKTVLRLLTHMEAQRSPADLMAMFADVLLYLYGVRSLAFLAFDGEHFRPLYSSGQLRGAAIGRLCFDEAVRIVQEAVRERRSLFFDNPMDLRCLGFGREVESVHLFPLRQAGSEPLLLSIFNTTLGSSDQQEVFDLCQYIEFLLSTIGLRESYQEKLREMTVLHFATAGLPELFQRPESMYDSIVDAAVRLAGAEKGSLLLAEQNREELKLKAAQGINTWFLQDLRIRAGEGIAGKVFLESAPVISRDIEKDFAVQKKPQYRTPSFMCIPLKVGEETIGVLNISDKITGEVFNEEDLAFLKHFAHFASIAIKGLDYYSLAEELKELSITDPLTGLYNRRYFQERLSEEVDRSDRHQLKFSLAILDIDDFKLFNDSEGHLAGDDMLKRLADVVHGSLRAIDVFARIGGEEFAIIMPQTDSDEAHNVTERVRQSIAQNISRTWQNYPRNCLTVSIGIASFPRDDVTARRIFWKADKALYAAKVLGKNMVRVWEIQMGNMIQEP